ncbi:MAG: RecQ family ATP-dependent DNA helicase [Candidatus Brocadiaceae bacterium]|nr:RecQ family ATP-dependent DNA helicase [Candidatus Brocadiaceae bacterium]
MTITKQNPADILQRYFGHPAFRWQQEQVIEHVLRGNHALVIAPTGMGKSVCYQIPAIVNNNLTVVISPLIALMKDQVDTLTRRGIDAAYINSSLNPQERETRYAAVEHGDYKLIYVTPERFRKAEFIKAITKRRIDLLAVDEAHCISEWGHDFRPDYTRLQEIRSILGNPAIIALTATATPDVQADIIHQLGLKADQIKIFHEGINRPNLHLAVEEVWGDEEKLARILRITDRYNNNGIVYFTLIRNLNRFSEHLTKQKVPHVCYHGKLDAPRRSSIHERFMQKDTMLVLATNAFGMGIDKENIRMVIHADIPGSMESYYQEIGRAGRDGLDAQCTLLYDEEDLLTQMEFIQWSNPNAEYYQQVHHILKRDCEKISTYGMDWLKDTLHRKNRNDYRMETALNMLDRYGVTERVDGSPCLKIINDLPPRLLDQKALEDKRIRDQKKLYAMVQYAKHQGNRKAFIHRYFGLPYGEKEGGRLSG